MSPVHSGKGVEERRGEERREERVREGRGTGRERERKRGGEKEVKCG